MCKKVESECQVAERFYEILKQPFRDVLRKRYSENMQQIDRRTTMSKCDFDKVALQLH